MPAILEWAYIIDRQNTVQAIYEHGVVKFGQLSLPFWKSIVKTCQVLLFVYYQGGFMGQSQWSWVPIQTKSKVKVQTGIEKSLLCHRSKIEKGP